MSNASPWTLLNRSIAYASPWFNVNVDLIRLPDGKEIRYHNVDFPRPAVGIVALNDDMILLIRQYRYLIDCVSWAIPSGGVEPGESLVQAASRELAEEAGYAVGPIEPLISFNPSYGATNQQFHIFLARNVAPLSAHFDTNEVIEIRWFSILELERMIRNGDIVDGLSLPGLLMVCGWSRQ